MKIIDEFKKNIDRKKERNKKKYYVQDISMFLMEDSEKNLYTRSFITNNDETKFKDILSGEIYDFNDEHINKNNGKLYASSMGYVNLPAVRRERIKEALLIPNRSGYVHSIDIVEEIPERFFVKKFGPIMIDDAEYHITDNTLISERDIENVGKFVVEKYSREREEEKAFRDNKETLDKEREF